nr:MazG nucleotide pyrophosphohydrolase domain-containing protein [Candidatus Gracilibacteria bacterium]
MKTLFQKILDLSESRISEFEEDIRKPDSLHKEFYIGFETYLRGLAEEIEETKDEIKYNNSVYLEDELGDVFWDYMCLLQSLQKRGYISSVEKVFERSYKKFSERIEANRQTTGCKSECWKDIKRKQKEELKTEQDKINNNFANS